MREWKRRSAVALDDTARATADAKVRGRAGVGSGLDGPQCRDGRMAGGEGAVCGVAIFGEPEAPVYRVRWAPRGEMYAIERL